MPNLFRLPRKVHHGLLLVTELAALHDRSEALALDAVAAKAGISRGYLEQVAAVLRRAGLIKGRRGPGGGYRLTRAPAQISVAQVIEAIVGPLSLMECLNDRQVCLLADQCASRSIWSRLEGKIAASLRELTVAELAGAKKIRSVPYGCPNR